jgi:hypothetical protein
MRGCKVRSSVNWQGALKQKGLKEMGIEQGLPVIFCDFFCNKSIIKITTGKKEQFIGAVIYKYFKNVVIKLLYAVV